MFEYQITFRIWCPECGGTGIIRRIRETPEILRGPWLPDYHVVEEECSNFGDPRYPHFGDRIEVDHDRAGELEVEDVYYEDGW